MASHVNPSKRPFQKNSSEHNGRAKWQKTKHSSSQQPQLVIQPGVPLIRILCPTEKCGNVIGKGGGIIAKIRQENGVKIRVDEAVPGCDERVIVITATEKEKEASHEQGKENDGGASVSADGEHEKEKDHSKEEEEKNDADNVVGKEEKVDSEINDSKEEKDDSSVTEDTKLESERIIPSPMNAILHVFDRIFITEIENGTGDASAQRTPVSFRMLVLDSQVGWLLGNRGSVIKQMSTDSGCEIRVSKEKLPLCALLKDELCQITGDLQSVRKGLNAVTQVLFTHPPRESDVVPVAHPSGSSSHSFNRPDGPPGMQPNFHLPFQGPSHARGPFDIIDQRPNIAPFPTFPDQRSNIPPFPAFPDALMHGHPSVPPEPLTFRLLCSSDKVGSIIGKGGNNIKTIQNDTGCEIKIVETVPKTEERVIVISGPAHPGDGISPAQNAILHVQRRITPPTSNNKEGPAISRLIVSPNQVGCLLGKGGSIIAEMRKLSKAHIIVLAKDKIPRGVQESDEVVQITGDSEAIQEALMQITARLRNNLFRDRMASLGPNMQPPFGSLDPQFRPFAGIHESSSPRIYPNAPQFHKDFMGRPLDEMSAPWTTKDVGDPMSISGMPGMAQRGMGGFSGPNVTGNIMVPRLVIPALCGHDGGCLNKIREFSGAKITIDEPLADSMDTPVTIFGTPDQMHAARSLIQAFVLSEPPVP